MKLRISIQQLFDEAEKHDQIALQYRGIAASLKGLNPNIEMIISHGRENENPSIKSAPLPASAVFAPILQTATKLDAVKWVLKNAHPRALAKSDIETIMQKQGFAITPETLSSYLSRNKEIFKAEGRGLWKLKDPAHTLERDDPT